MAEKKLMKGNEAFATAAMNAGCRYYFGYPITPQNEVFVIFRNFRRKGYPDGSFWSRVIVQQE